MASLHLNGSPRTAARQLVELLTRDNILDEAGNVNQATVEAANNYARAPRQQTLEEYAVEVGVSKEFLEAIRPPPSADSTRNSRSDSPADKSEPRTQEGNAPACDTARKQTT